MCQPARGKGFALRRGIGRDLLTCANESPDPTTNKREMVYVKVQNGTISGFPKPSPIRWFERVSAETSFYAAFRPLFRQVGRWCTGIPFETGTQSASGGHHSVVRVNATLLLRSCHRDYGVSFHTVPQPRLLHCSLPPSLVVP